jgi:chromosome partitioning protein
MRIISVQNFKGGTGKTTTVVNLGMGLALRGHRVLAIDLDAQGSVATWLGVPCRRTIGDVLLGTSSWRECVITARTRFDVIPCDRRLVDVETELTQRGELPDLLRRRMAGVELAGYDYVLIDCSPSISLLSECALRFSRDVFVPVSMEYLALVGARTVVIEVLRSRRLAEGQSARLSLVIPSFYSSADADSNEILQMLHHHFPGIVSHPIRMSRFLTEAPSHRRTIFEYDPRGNGSIDYARLVEQVAGSTTTVMASGAA